MRKLYKNVISKSDANDLIKSAGAGKINSSGDARLDTRIGTLQWDSPILNKVFLKLKEDYPKLKLGEPSYLRVETLTKGHKPHFDGCKIENDAHGKPYFAPNHMSWCAYSASVLLSDPSSYDGGEFKFLDEPEEAIKDEHYLSMVFFSSGAHNEPEKHTVEKHANGDRYVILMFFAEEE